MFGREMLYGFLDSVSCGIIILVPVYDSAGGICDFRIEFINRLYREGCPEYITAGKAISTLGDAILNGSGVDWYGIGIATICEGRSLAVHYYSPVLQTCLCLTAYRAGKKRCMLMLTTAAVSPPASPEMVLRRQLKKAAQDKKFELQFQPQYAIRTNRIRGFEALIRWTDGVLGVVSPDSFVPVAEQSDMIVEIGQWVLERSVQTLHHWQSFYSYQGIMSVNISPVQLAEKNFITTVLKLIDQYHIAPGTLELEITERVLINNIEESMQKLCQLRSAGILIALDDFGTGYSSFYYLNRLPVSALKIDRSFISSVCDADRKSAVITESIVSLASRLGMETIAEGVESYCQLDLLRRWGCTTVQGFLHGRPMPRSQCERLINRADF